MARLILPTAGTVVTVEGDLESLYRATGWVDADASDQQEQAPSEKPDEKPAPRARRARKN